MDMKQLDSKEDQSIAHPVSVPSELFPAEMSQPVKIIHITCGNFSLCSLRKMVISKSRDFSSNIVLY